MIRVLVVRDAGYFGVPVRTLIESKPDMHYIGTLPIDGNLVERAAQLWPTVIVIDTELMVSQVLPFATDLHAAIPSCAMLVLCDPAKRGMLPPRRRRCWRTRCGGWPRVSASSRPCSRPPP